MRQWPAILSIAIAVQVFARSAGAQDRIWAPEERITITSFNEVYAIAYDGQRVFGATRNGLEIFDALARRWLAPSTIEDGYPVFEQPVAIAFDRREAGLWLVTATGNTYLWSELSGRWDIRMPGSAPAELLQGAQVAPNDPAWRVLRASLTLDPSGRRWPLTAVAPADRPGTYWAATAGANMLAVDTRNLSSQWLAFGTLSRGINAIAPTDHGALWFGGDGLGPRAGLTRADLTLQEWLSYDAHATRAPRGLVHRILPGDTTWVAASDGLYLLPAGARSWRRLDERDGLPSANVRAAVRSAHALWIGTQQGLAVIDPAGGRAIWREMAGVRINGLAVRADTVWIASAVGLWIGVFTGNEFKVLAAPGTENRPQLRRSVAAVARAANYIAVLASDGVRLYDDAWSGVIPEAGAFAGSRLHDLRGDDRTLFVLGSRALGVWDVQTNEWRRLTVPADVPEGPVRDAVRAGDALWVATPAGAVRLNWP